MLYVDDATSRLLHLHHTQVERAHQTLQDRLVKELRLRGISKRVDANAYAREFIAAYNRRFASRRRRWLDSHRVSGHRVEGARVPEGFSGSPHGAVVENKLLAHTLQVIVLAVVGNR